MTFTEDWFSTASCSVLQRLVIDTMSVRGEILEIGSWEGRSTCSLAYAAHPKFVHACDTWQGSPGEISADLAAGRDVYATFRANVDELTNGNVTVHRMGWRELMAEWTDPFRLVFIDAEHTYTEVADTIRTVLPLMASGGIICGDDQHHPPIREAVMDTLGNAMVDASVWYWRNP